MEEKEEKEEKVKYESHQTPKYAEYEEYEEYEYDDRHGEYTKNNNYYNYNNYYYDDHGYEEYDYLNGRDRRRGTKKRRNRNSSHSKRGRGRRGRGRRRNTEQYPVYNSNNYQYYESKDYVFNDYIPKPAENWRNNGPRRRGTMRPNFDDRTQQKNKIISIENTENTEMVNDNNGSIGDHDDHPSNNGDAQMMIYQNHINSGVADGGFSQLSTRKSKKWTVKHDEHDNEQDHTQNEFEYDSDLNENENTHHIFVRDTEHLDFSTIKQQYRDIVVICQFSEKYHSKNGLMLLKNRTILQRLENQKHGYCVLDAKPVSSGMHCWRIKCKNFSPWIFIGISRPFVEYTDTSWNNKYVWGISTCSQSNRNGHWSLDYSVKSPTWKNKQILEIDMLLDCYHGTIQYKEIQKNNIDANSKPNVITLVGLEKNRNKKTKDSDDKGAISWIPHFNLHTPGSTVSVKKIPHSRFGQIW